MPASKIKNLIIFILVLANLFLLALVLPARREKTKQTQQEDAQIAALFAEAGVTLEIPNVPTAKELYPMEVTCSEDGQRTAATALIGEPITQTQNTDSVEMVGAVGSCTLDDFGTLEVFFDATTETSDILADAQTRLKATALDCTPPRLSEDGQTVSAYLRVSGSPIFTDPATFTYQNGTPVCFTALLAVPRTTVRTDKTSGISAQDALLAFYGSRMETGWVGSQITGITQGYTAKAAMLEHTLALTPCWRIETDTGAFLVDGITAAVSPA